MATARRCILLLGGLLARAASGLQIKATEQGLSFVDDEGVTLLTNTIFSGPSTENLAAVEIESRKRASNRIQWTAVENNAVRISVAAAQEQALAAEEGAVTTAAFNFVTNETFYGVWEYPWNGTITNQNIDFEVKGLFGDQPGVNYANARAPFFFTRSGFGVYVDTLEMGRFTFSGRSANFTFPRPQLSYQVIYNRDLKALLMQYANMSSKPSMPPNSGYGPIFWSDNMLTDFHGDVSNAEENYYDIVDKLYYNEIRATAMFADRPYGTGNWSFGNFDFDPKFFPDPKAFIANLSDWGYDFQVWVANRAFLNTTLMRDANASGWLFPGIDPEIFLGPALNLSIPEAYDYVLEKLKFFTDLGVKGYKIDRGEELEMPDSEQNIQNQLLDDLCYQSMLDAWGEGNFFIFTRSAVDRSRSQVAIWNGDPQATFEGLAYSVASGIRAGLLLFSTWGSDIGGYLREAGGNSPTEELWARWMQFGAFSPMYEIMVGTGHTPWYEPYTSGLVDVLKQTADWHTKLIPYIRSFTYQATQTGIPVMRALFLEFPIDDFAYTIADEYMFGDYLLVAPYVTAGGSRTVFFPTGAKFLEYLNKTAIHEGGTNTTVSLGLDALPVYVREGAIIPTGDIHQGNAKWVENYTSFLDIEFFPSYAVNMTTVRYLRDDGEIATITARTNRTASTVTISYTDLGVGGSLKIYSANGLTTIPMPESGGSMTLTLSYFASIFDGRPNTPPVRPPVVPVPDSPNPMLPAPDSPNPVIPVPVPSLPVPLSPQPTIPVPSVPVPVPPRPTPPAPSPPVPTVPVPPAPEPPTPEIPQPETPAPEVPPVVPVVPVPETPAPEEPTPEVPAPETPEPETPPVPEVPDTPAPETPAPETPPPVIPVVPTPGTPEPEIPAPEVPDIEVPAPVVPTPIPEVPAPETPAPEVPVPEIPTPDVPPTIPIVPTPVPPVPETPVPPVVLPVPEPEPEVPAPETPPVIPEVPEIPVPEVPEVPEIPDVPSPQVPEVPAPEPPVPEPTTTIPPTTPIPSPGGPVIGVPSTGPLVPGNPSPGGPAIGVPSTGPLVPGMPSPGTPVVGPLVPAPPAPSTGPLVPADPAPVAPPAIEVPAPVPVAPPVPDAPAPVAPPAPEAPAPEEAPEPAE